MSNGMIMLFPFCACITSLLATSVADDHILEQYEKDSSHVLSVLSNPETWNDAYYARNPQKTENLLKYLNFAEKLKCGNIEKKLCEHLTYDPRMGMAIANMLSPEKQFPVFSVMHRIGIKSVPPLIDLIKTSESSRTRNLAVQCIIKIYEQGGEGVKMTKQRLSLEVTTANGMEKKHLEECIASSVFE